MVLSFIKQGRTGCTNNGPSRKHLLLVCCSLLLLAGCGGKQLKPWHTERLTEEFSASDLSDVSTFEDYLRQEEVLFQQMLDKAYIPSAPEHLFVRYSRGSAADPMMQETNWNRSFVLRSAEPRGGVLLLHGLSDSPYSLRAMAETLHEQGYTVVGLRLPGHGTAPSGIVYVRWRDMAAAVGLAMDYLDRELGSVPLHIVGYSTGAPLALDYSLKVIEGEASRMPASLVMISPAIGVTPAAGLAKVASGLSVLPGLKGLAWTAVQPEYDPYKYNSFTSNAGDQVYKVTKSVSKRVSKQADKGWPQPLPPILAFLSVVDATVSTQALVDKLLSKLDPGRHELVLFDIDRYGANASLLKSDPGPLTQQLIADPSLPVDLTLITNQNSETERVVEYRRKGLTTKAASFTPLGLEWPFSVFSLSHVALPIPPGDPIYGATRPENERDIYLGKLDAWGEKGMLIVPSESMVRLRYNPFYDYLQSRALDWIDTSGSD